ncbi:hypothetical protein JCM4914_75640 [Streptomyces platensis subsp. malvinus]
MTRHGAAADTEACGESGGVALVARDQERHLLLRGARHQPTAGLLFEVREVVVQLAGGGSFLGIGSVHESNRAPVRLWMRAAW